MKSRTSTTTIKPLLTLVYILLLATTGWAACQVPTAWTKAANEGLTATVRSNDHIPTLAPAWGTHRIFPETGGSTCATLADGEYCDFDCPAGYFTNLASCTTPASAAGCAIANIKRRVKCHDSGDTDHAFWTQGGWCEPWVVQLKMACGGAAFGATYSNVEIVDAAKCRDACEVDPLCMAVTWDSSDTAGPAKCQPYSTNVKPSVAAATKTCWTKAAVTIVHDENEVVILASQTTTLKYGARWYVDGRVDVQGVFAMEANSKVFVYGDSALCGSGNDEACAKFTISGAGRLTLEARHSGVDALNTAAVFYMMNDNTPGTTTPILEVTGASATIENRGLMVFGARDELGTNRATNAATTVTNAGTITNYGDIYAWTGASVTNTEAIINKGDGNIYLQTLSKTFNADSVVNEREGMIHIRGDFSNTINGAVVHNWGEMTMYADGACYDVFRGRLIVHAQGRFIQKAGWIRVGELCATALASGGAAPDCNSLTGGGGTPSICEGTLTVVLGDWLIGADEGTCAQVTDKGRLCVTDQGSLEMRWAGASIAGNGARRRLIARRTDSSPWKSGVTGNLGNVHIKKNGRVSMTNWIYGDNIVPALLPEAAN